MEGGNRQSWRGAEHVGYEIPNWLYVAENLSSPLSAALQQWTTLKIEGIVNCLEFCLVYIGRAMGALLSLDSGVGRLGAFGRELFRGTAAACLGWKRMVLNTPRYLDGTNPRQLVVRRVKAKCSARERLPKGDHNQQRRGRRDG